jgi:hypothetical protein
MGCWSHAAAEMHRVTPSAYEHKLPPIERDRPVMQSATVPALSPWAPRLVRNGRWDAQRTCLCLAGPCWRFRGRRCSRAGGHAHRKVTLTGLPPSPAASRPITDAAAWTVGASG